MGYNHAFAITPSDADPVPAHEGIYVGGAGNLTVITRVPDGFGGFTETSSVLTAPVVGQVLPISVHKVMATGTTATLLVGLR